MGVQLPRIRAAPSTSSSLRLLPSTAPISSAVGYWRRIFCAISPYPGNPDQGPAPDPNQAINARIRSLVSGYCFSRAALRGFRSGKFDGGLYWLRVFDHRDFRLEGMVSSQRRSSAADFFCSNCRSLKSSRALVMPRVSNQRNQRSGSLFSQSPLQIELPMAVPSWFQTAAISFLFLRRAISGPSMHAQSKGPPSRFSVIADLSSSKSLGFDDR